MNDFLIHGNIPVTLYSNILPFRDPNKSVKIDIDILKTTKNYKINVDHSNPQDRKTNRESAEEKSFGGKNTGRPSTSDKSLIKVLKSPIIMTSEILTLFLPSDTNETCDRLKLLLKENCWKQI